MTDVNVSGIGSQVLGIAGMGIGLGMLAGTSRAVMDTMYGDRWRPPPRKRRTSKRRYMQPYKPRGGPYNYHLKPIKRPRW